MPEEKNKSLLELEKRLEAIQSDVAGSTKGVNYNLENPKKISNSRKKILDKAAKNLNAVRIPYEGTRRSLYGQDYKGAIGRGTIEAFGGQTFGKYTEGALPWQDPVEYSAQNQSIGEQLGYGALRLVGTTVTKMGQMLGYNIGFMGGVLNQDWSVMLDNGISSAFRNLEEQYKELLPIQHRRKYLEGNILEQMGTLGFWTDDFADGVAFLMAAYLMAGGVQGLMKGAGTSPKLARLFSRYTKGVKTGNVINPKAANIEKFVGDIDIVTMSFFNSVGEAGIEASDLKKQLIDKELSNEESSKAAMNTFWTNLTILMVSNYITNSMFFKPFKSSRRSLSGVFKNNKLIKEELKDLSTKDLAGIFARKAALSMASEGLWEENIQLASQDYEEKLALGEEDRNRVTGLIGNMFNNLFTDEGQKSIVLGSLIGLIPGGVGGIKQARAERKGMQAMQSIMGMTLAGYENQIQDFYEKDPESGAVIIDENTKQPKLDYAKISEVFNQTLNSMSNIGYSLAALESSNETMFDFLREERFASLALNFLSQEDGVKHLKNQIDLYAQQEVEDLERAGNYLDKDTVADLKNKYRERADLYKNIYDSIVNNYLAFPEFDDGSSDANKFKNRLLVGMFMEGVNQNFWADKKVELESEISELEMSDTKDFKLTQDKIKSLNKTLEDVNKLVEESQTRFKDIADSKKQSRNFNEYRKELQKIRDAVEKHAQETEEQAPEDKRPNVLTAKDGKQYNYIGFENDTYSIRDLETGDVLELSPEEFKDQGFKAEDLETGEVTELSDVYVDDKGEEYEYVGKQDKLYVVRNKATGYEIPMDEAEFNEFKENTHLKEGVIDSVQGEVSRRADSKEAYRQIIKDRIQAVLSTTEGQQDSQALNQILLEEYGDPQYDNTQLGDLFDEYNIIDFIPAIYDGKVGELSYEGSTVIFKDLNGKKYEIGNLQSTSTLIENGIRVFRNFVFDMEVNNDGKTLTVNGVNLTNENYTPTDAIIEDKEGNPTEVRLLNDEGKVVSITNPMIVYDIANAIYTIEELRNNLLGLIKEGGEDFVYVKDPESATGKEYAVYNIDGMWRVINPKTGKGYFKTLNDRILDVFYNQLHDNLSNFADLVRTLDFKGDKLNKNEIRDELNAINDIIRSATPAEINESKSSAEVPSTETKRAKEAQETDESINESASEESQKDIVENKAEESSERTAEKTFDDTTPTKEDVEDTSEGIEPINISETVNSKGIKPDANLPEKGLRRVADAVSYQYEENVEFNEWVSNRRNTLAYNFLEASYDPTVQYPKDQDHKNPWVQFPEIMGRIEQGNLTDAEIDSILEAKSENEFGYPVDVLPIKMIMKDSEGNSVPGKPLYYHVSNWWNVHIPKEIREQGEEAIKEHKRQLWIEARGVRRKLLKQLLKGNKVKLSNLSKTAGQPNTVSLEEDNRNSKLTNVFEAPLNKMRLALADNTGTIRTGNNVDIPSMGTPTPGNIFYITDETCNGSTYPVNLNVSKLSREHAEILLKALVVAYDSKGGRSTLYPGKEVTNLTVGEVIQLLALEGENFTRQDNKENPKPYLLNKQLYVKKKIIHFGKNGQLPIDPKKRKDSDIEDFIKWATRNKNYVVISKKLGNPFKKNFKIGSFEAKNGQIYDTFLIDNGVVKSDLTPGMPFHAPVVIMDPNTIETAETKTAKKPHEPKETVSKSAETKTEKVRVTVDVYGPKAFKDMPVGTKLYVEDVTYENYGTEEQKEIVEKQYQFEIVQDGDKRVLKSIHEPDTYKERKYKEYQGTDIENTDALSKLTDSYNLTGNLKYQYIEENPITEEEAKKDGKSSDDILDDLNPFRERSLAPEQYTPADIRKELKWLKKRLPGDSVKVVDDLIRVNGKIAFGQLRKDAIILSNAAEEGTLYHEAFHRVSLSYLTDAQRAELYKAAKKKYKLEDTADKFVEERLAEEFRKYVIAEDKQQASKSLPQKIADFFKDIWNSIVSVFGGRDALSYGEVEKVFEAINKGAFKNAKLQYDNRYYKENLTYLNEKTGLTANQIKSVVKNVVYLAFTLNNVHTLGDLSNIKYDVVRDKLNELRNAFDREGKTNKVELFDTILDEYSEFVKMADSYLTQLKVYKDLDELEDAEKGLDLVKYDETSYEVDIKDNILSAVKMLVMTLPEGRDEFTGMFSFVEFNSTFNRLLNDLHNFEDIYEMLDYLKEMGNTYTPYKVLHKRLTEGDELLRTQFEVSLKSAKHKFIDITYELVDDKPVFKFQSTDVQKVSKKVVREWSEIFFDSDMFEGKYKKLSAEKVQDLSDRFTNILKDARSYGKLGEIPNYEGHITDLINIFNELSIPLDETVLNTILASKEDVESIQAAFKDFVVNDVSQLFASNSTLVRRSKGGKILVNGKELADKELFTNEKIIDQIAQAYIVTRPEEMSVTVLGPGGNPYYTYSQNNYVTDIVREINKDPEKVAEMLTSVYSAKSYILNTLKANPKKRREFGINTFSGFIQLGVGDSGRDYTELNDIENILLKVTGIQNNMLPLPTMADRRTYYLFKGVTPISFDLLIDSNNNIKTDPNSEAVNVFVQHAQAEKDRVELAKKQIERAFEDKNNIDTSHLVQEFHYKIDNNKGDAVYYEKMDDGLYKIFKYKSGRYAGNGTKFQHFKIFNKEEFSDVKSKVIKALEGNIQTTIKMMTDLGIINADEINGEYKIRSNKLLDKEFVKKLAKENYNGNTVAAIYKMIADYAVNTSMGTIETEMIFSGDVAFYEGNTPKKINENKVKRLSVQTSTGSNTRTNYPEGHELYNKLTYNVTTLNTHEVDSVYYDSLFDRHVKYYKNIEGLDDNESSKRATKRLKNYRKVDPTDAQVYISPTMAKSLLIRWGEFTEEMSAAFDILESETKPSLQEEQQALALVIPVLKTVYFEMQYRDGLGVPIFDKMSMAPLFRRIVEGTDLMDLYERMEATGKYKSKKPIHTAKHDTAVKVGNMGRSNYYRDDLKTEITDFNERDLEYHPQKFKYLRKQLVTDPHESERTLFGTQVKKIIMSNIDKTAKYTFKGKEVDGETVINTIMEAVNSLSNKGREKLLRKLGIEEDGGKLDSAKLLKMLREDARKSGMSDNIIKALTIEDGKIKLPFDALPERKWIYSRFISMINKHAIDLMLPGGSYIQMSNFGLKTILDKDVNNFESKVDWFEKGTTELKFYRYGDVKTLPMECVVSVNMFKDVIPNYANLSFEQKEEWIKNNPEIIGYRIPTQGMNSVSYMKVVGLLPENIGDTIILPAEFTALTGSDFDIDKLYAVRYNYDKTGNEITDVEKTPYLDENNSTVKERATKYAHEALSDEVAEINKRIALRIKEESSKNNMTKAEIDELKLKIGELSEYIEIDYENEEFWRDELLDSKELKEALYSLMKDRNKTIQRIKDIREKAIDRIVTKWVNNNLTDFSKRSIIDQNTSRAVENYLMDAYMSLLSSNNSFIHMTTPLDSSTSMVSSIVAQIRKLQGIESEYTPSLYETFPEYQEAVKRKYSGGKSGIGPFALNNVHHILGQIVGLGLKTNIGIGKTNEKGNTDLSQIKDVNGNYILDWLSALINAHVDIAKDPYIFDLNVNKRTYSLTNLLVRAGVGEDAFYFLAQPILKELTREASLQRGRLVVSKKSPGAAIKRKYTELYSKALRREKKKDDAIELPETLWDNELLQKGINVKTEKDALYYKTQLAILAEFQKLDKQANYLNELVMASRTDTKGYGKNNAEMKAFTNTYNKVVDSEAIDNYEKIFSDTFIGTYFDNSIGLSEELFSNQTITGTRAFKNVLDKILKITGNKYSNDAIFISALEDGLFSMIAGQFFINEEYGLNMDFKKVRKLFFSEKGLVNNIYNLKVKNSPLLEKYPELENNRLLQIMQADFSEDAAIPDKLRIQNSSIKEKWDKEDISRSWKDLIYHEDETVSKIGRGLVLYAFYGSGLSRNLYSFFEYMPTEYLADIGFGEFFRTMLNVFKDEKGETELANRLDDLFKNEWIRHKAANSSTKPLVPMVSGIFGARVSETFGEGKPYLVSFIHNEDSPIFQGYDSYDNPVYSPYFKSKVLGDIVLYRFIGRDSDGNPIYRITSKKGYYEKGFTIKEYGLSRSIIDDNNIFAQYVDTNKLVEEYLNTKIDGFTPVEISELDVIKENLDEIEGNETKYEHVMDDKVGKEVVKESITKPAKRTIDYSKSWQQLKNMPVYSDAGVNTMRTLNKEAEHMHFGNPFSGSGVKGLIPRPSIQSAISAYKQWLTGESYTKVKPEQRKWILNEIDSGRLDNQALLYDKKLADRGYGSHAEVLAEVIQERRGEVQEIVEEESPFVTDTEIQERGVDVIFSTESQEVTELVTQLGIESFEEITDTQMKELRDKYKHCK